ncbi:hypothetical protein A2773_00745 [Candidatus Gottesmanbacteria bacterium RIFCSPHIGHO2_01_FULL_39_10]|uniref:Peptidase A2 domain-containing protein n=1 Tax=Candidatus Gottesmanbacteria bacterium RIFCSPHIGHO2_01_FULL_39_10 TaxID=1798375 RepID=A0A1F5ZLV9_9BACT|nr:MAG: hypothetical protein A2773_00745 [Candidatus Gottesmanbacteria bacterium RIFCSPHIGHO2_01_FULL_39_10]
MDVKFQFEDIGNSFLGHIYRPVAQVTLQSPKILTKSVLIWMIVDTGADYTIIPNHFSEKLRISLEKDCVKDTTYGVGGNQVVYFYKDKIKARIGDLERKIPIAFFANNEVPALLGRLGFLETFDTTFLKNHITVFKE